MRRRTGTPHYDDLQSREGLARNDHVLDFAWIDLRCGRNFGGERFGLYDVSTAEGSDRSLRKLLQIHSQDGIKYNTIFGRDTCISAVFEESEVPEKECISRTFVTLRQHKTCRSLEGIVN